MPSPSLSEYSPSFGSVGNWSTLSALPSPSVSALFGFVPMLYSWALVKPSPSGSPLASPPLVGERPLATSHPSGRPSLSLSALFMLVPWVCSSALVKPSPSQSAPPSDGSNGSVPSPLTAETAESAKNIAKSTLTFFLFIFHFSLFCFLTENPLFSLSESRLNWPADDFGSLMMLRTGIRLACRRGRSAVNTDLDY